MSNEPLCWVCDKPLGAHDGPGRPRHYCGAACKQAAKNARAATRRREWQSQQAAVWNVKRQEFRRDHLGEAA